MRIGIDVGGTKIEGVVLDPQGVEVARIRVPTPHDDYPSFLKAVADLVGALEARAGARCSVGVGTPGFLSPETGLIPTTTSNPERRNSPLRICGPRAEFCSAILCRISHGRQSAVGRQAAALLSPRP
jgi:predicted NBD/HSP70 family sugar kinase